MFRNRRLFWGITFGLALAAVSLSGWWWYQANFPLPKYIYAEFPNHKVTGLLMEQRGDWLYRKFSSRTMQLDLRGTRWKDDDSGAVAEFGSDEVFKWIHRPYPGQEKVATGAVTLDGTPVFGFLPKAFFEEIDRDEEEQLANANYRLQLDPDQFVSWDRNGSTSISGRNIFFETSDGTVIEGTIGSDGKSLGLAAGSHFHLLFDRQID